MSRLLWPNYSFSMSHALSKAPSYQPSARLLIECLSFTAVLTVNAASLGGVVAWGWNFRGETNVPAGLSRVTSVAGGSYHSLALKIDGNVVAWGETMDGSGATDAPVGLSGVTAIAAATTAVPQQTFLSG